ncbi:MAG TPA: hypothetical protein VKX17_07230 [Planctomycetota bacterium]|nr:hypothetical protein [Planctomycetota bacterium]
MAVYIKNRLRGFALLFVLTASAGAFAADAPSDGRIRLHVRASDPYGGKLTFKWVQVDGPEAKLIDATAAVYDDNTRKWISEPYFVPSKPGTYTFRVSVKNEDGVESQKTFVLEAKKGGTE